MRRVKMKAVGLLAVLAAALLLGAMPAHGADPVPGKPTAPAGGPPGFTWATLPGIGPGWVQNSILDRQATAKAAQAFGFDAPGDFPVEGYPGVFAKPAAQSGPFGQAGQTGQVCRNAAGQVVTCQATQSSAPFQAVPPAVQPGSFVQAGQAAGTPCANGQCPVPQKKGWRR